MQALVSLVLVVSSVSGLIAIAGFEGSPHDFAFATSDKRVGCMACHHPHTPSGKALRWHMGPERTRPFSLYQTRAGLPDRSTLICLSCHDGAIASEIAVGGGGIIASQIGRSHSVWGEQLSVSTGSHPVGVPYVEHNPKYVSKAAIEAEGAIRLPGGRVECISCHDPHGKSGYRHLLVKPDRRSALCLSCHRL
jgi:predicted CXXCH cytochrome family protein